MSYFRGRPAIATRCYFKGKIKEILSVQKMKSGPHKLLVDRLPMSGFLELVCYSEPPLVSAQKVVAAWAGVGHLLHAVHTTGDTGAWPESYEAEKPPNNPGDNTGL